MYMERRSGATVAAFTSVPIGHSARQIFWCRGRGNSPRRAGPRRRLRRRRWCQLHSWDDELFGREADWHRRRVLRPAAHTRWSLWIDAARTAEPIDHARDAEIPRASKNTPGPVRSAASGRSRPSSRALFPRVHLEFPQGTAKEAKLVVAAHSRKCGGTPRE